MLILPVRTGRLKHGNDLAAILQKNFSFSKGDIVVISSKAIATIEGAEIDLKKIQPSEDAKKIAPKCHQDSAFTQVVLDETNRMNGSVVSVSPYAILTSLIPKGLKKGRILCPNAGLDQSNIADGFAIGWPLDPVVSAQQLSKALGVPVIISDSCCHPSREGVTAFALVCAGIDPLKNEIGNTDLFGKPMRVTREAVADQMAVAANAVMGNAGQSTPAAVIRDHGYPLSDFAGWVDGIDPEEDMFRGTL